MKKILLSAIMIFSIIMSGSLVYANDFITTDEMIDIENLSIADVVEIGFEWEKTEHPTILQTEEYYLGDYGISSTLNGNKVTTLIYNFSENTMEFYSYPLCDNIREINVNEIIVKSYDVDVEIEKLEASKARVEREQYISEPDEMQYEIYSNNPDTDREDWWGMEYYQNKNSAKKDRYWRLFYPGYEEESIYFFAYTTETAHLQALEFKDCVGQMILLEDECSSLGMYEVPDAILTLNEPEFDEILNLSSFLDLSYEEIELSYEIHCIKSSAERAYDIVRDSHTS